MCLNLIDPNVISSEKSIGVLEKTPTILESYLKNNEGKNTWNPYDIVGHLIFGEKQIGLYESIQS